MTRHLLNLAIFLAGLAAVAWIGAGYIGNNALALAVTALILLCYLAGAIELWRQQRANETLDRAMAQLNSAPLSLSGWLERLHPGWRHPVRQRIEGERVALPGPALTPYLVGLLVLLGMLGTFLGMVATLRGTGLALESATDLQAIRGSLSAPVHGLGFAFGTSIAGVATSAALGLLSALNRRATLRSARQLDVAIATSLRPFSRKHQQEESFRLMQQQTQALPEVVDKLNAMMQTMAQQHQALNERLLASQEAFYTRTETAYTQLADNVGQRLTQSAADSARAAGSAIQPAVENTLAGLAREAASWHDALTQTMQQQLEGLSGRFENTTTQVADIWNRAVTSQQTVNDKLTQDLQRALDRYAEVFEQRATQLLEGVSTRLDNTAASVSSTWNDALARQEQLHSRLADENRLALSQAASAFTQHAATLQESMAQSHAGLRSELASQDEQRLAGWSASLTAMAAALRAEWQQASEQAGAQQRQILEVLSRTADDIASRAQDQTRATLAEIDRLVQATAEAPKIAATMQENLVAREEQRIAAWTSSLADVTHSLREAWQQASAQASAQQQEVLASLSRAAEDIATQTREQHQALIATLADTAQDLTAQTREQTRRTASEVSQLLQTAAEAPKAVTAMQENLAARDQERIAAWTESLTQMAQALREEWRQASTQAGAQQQEILATLSRAADAITASAQKQTRATLEEIDRLVQATAEAPRIAVAMQEELVARDEQRIAAWTSSLAEVAVSLRETWQRTTEHTLQEVGQLLQAAAQAPQAAGEVISELRQKLTDSMARDNAMLEERNRLLDTLGNVLETVNHTADEQRSAVDMLVSTSSDLLDRVGTQLADKVGNETGKLSDVAAQMTGSAVEVASLGEAFGGAVQLFSESNAKLLEHLQRVEEALEKSIARSDEQLAYYVAQAREVVDLSMMSQKQILDDLQQLASTRAPTNTDAA